MHFPRTLSAVPAAASRVARPPCIARKRHVRFRMSETVWLPAAAPGCCAVLQDIVVEPSPLQRTLYQEFQESQVGDVKCNTADGQMAMRCLLV